MTALANLYIGVQPPVNPGPNVRWMSQSQRHLRVPPGAYARKPVIGGGVPDTNSGSEISPYWNELTGQYEMLFNQGNAQYFATAPTALGPWNKVGLSLGYGTGFETGAVSQAMILREGNTLYLFYCQNQTDLSIRLASSPIPTPANPAPVWTSIGVVFTATAGGGSMWVVKANGFYYMFVERTNTSLLLLKTAATSPAGMAATPFTIVSNNLDLFADFGVRGNQRWGRPQATFEDGFGWILTGHAIGTSEFGYQFIRRFTCTDDGDPINWVPDYDGPLVREENPLEVDQVADFRTFQGANGVWYAGWSANNNVTGSGTVMMVPMQEPVMAHDGGEWVRVSYTPDVLADFPYIDSDIINTNQQLRNHWDAWCNTTSAVITVTAPRPASRAFFKVTNGPLTFPGNHVKIAAAAATDRIMGPIAISAVAVSGSTVTVTTAQPHGLTTTDFVTVTGFAPAAYNSAVGTSYAVASVVDANNFTYTAASAPAAMTTLGCFDRSLRPGESRAYRSKFANTFVRD